MLALQVERHIGSGKVREVMERLVAEHGAPGFIRSDNGPEFVARSLREWLGWVRIKTLYIEPGSPWQNGFVESFHDKFRSECLARELFYTLGEARVVIADWRNKYNGVRPHRSLGMLTPEEFAAKSPRWQQARPGCGARGSDELGEPIDPAFRRSPAG